MIAAIFMTPSDQTLFQFELFDLSTAVDLVEWSNYLDTVPHDPYVPEGYRFKSIGWFRVKRNGSPVNPSLDTAIRRVNFSGPSGHESDTTSSSAPTWTTGTHSVWHLPQYSLQQSAAYNPVHGDLTRHYPSIPTHFVQRQDFSHLIQHYADFMGWEDDIVLLQFQRIVATSSQPGFPAVEGFHKDGNEHAGMLILRRENVTGAVSQISLDAHGETLIYDEVIPPGRLLYWHDRVLWHYATPLSVGDDGAVGMRDVVLMSAGAQQHMGVVREL